MTTKNNDLVALKKQIFHVSDELDMLRSSYDSLQVLIAGVGCDAFHVGAVLYSLNYRFVALMAELDQLYKRD